MIKQPHTPLLTLAWWEFNSISDLYQHLHLPTEKRQKQILAQLVIGWLIFWFHFILIFCVFCPLLLFTVAPLSYQLHLNCIIYFTKKSNAIQGWEWFEGCLQYLRSSLYCNLLFHHLEPSFLVNLYGHTYICNILVVVCICTHIYACPKAQESTECFMSAFPSGIWGYIIEFITHHFYSPRHCKIH